MPSTSWGALPWPAAAAEVDCLRRSALLPDVPETLIPYGNGRSYSDVCLNPGGGLLRTRGLDRFIDFDAERGILRCEAGVLLAEILDFIVPRGWFLPVTPGTRYITVGGAIANDVHGKNHHAAGSFGDWVRSFELLRSDGTRRCCSAEENPGWFAATIGGLGLTGLIVWAELQLKAVQTAGMDVHYRRFSGLDEFFELNAAAEREHEYAVAWIDCLAATPRGVLMSGDHAREMRRPPRGRMSDPPRLGIPFAPPFSAINRASLKLFNCLYYRKPWPSQARVPAAPYFYPLDALGHWNRIYGKRGFYQYQCVIPPRDAPEAIAGILRIIAKSGQGSFLAVLKTFGERPARGMLSFPMPGTTLALDFPNRGEATLSLFARLDEVVASTGGRLYPAKDARMPGTLFRSAYPRLEEFRAYVDPKFSSGFWRQVSDS
ncbi:MAG: FAD-binding oxidoreductase [Betaproteobacteria bacterium]|nr:FAD-binding oxidoreductase [Betaproteobacteria bacterium]